MSNIRQKKYTRKHTNHFTFDIRYSNKIIHIHWHVQRAYIIQFIPPASNKVNEPVYRHNDNQLILVRKYFDVVRLNVFPTEINKNRRASIKVWWDWYIISSIIMYLVLNQSGFICSSFLLSLIFFTSICCGEYSWDKRTALCVVSGTSVFINFKNDETQFFIELIGYLYHSLIMWLSISKRIFKIGLEDQRLPPRTS